MITDFSEAYSQYDADGCPVQVDIHVTFKNRTEEEGELVEKIRLMLIAQMIEESRIQNKRGSKSK